jgi:hypothetical protein
MAWHSSGWHPASGPASPAAPPLPVELVEELLATAPASGHSTITWVISVV